MMRPEVFAGLFACVSAVAVGAVQVVVPAGSGKAVRAAADAFVRCFSPLPEPTDYLSKLRAMEHPIRTYAPDPAARTKANYQKVIRHCRNLSATQAPAPSTNDPLPSSLLIPNP